MRDIRQFNVTVVTFLDILVLTVGIVCRKKEEVRRKKKEERRRKGRTGRSRVEKIIQG